jgi:transposase
MDQNMPQQGKQLSPEAINFVVCLKQYFDKERKAGKVVSTMNPTSRTAAGLGVGIATVKRIMSRHVRGEPARQPFRPGRPPGTLGVGIQPAVRKFIHTENLSGKRVSIERVRSYLSEEFDVDVPKMTLWRALRRWGFTYGQGRRRDSLKEQDYVIRARREYLRQKRANRSSGGLTKHPEFFLDETFINKNHSARYTWYNEQDGPWVNKPSGVGPRLIVLNAISRGGWVQGAKLVFEAKKRTGDYHGQMNWHNFSKWFRDQLIPNLPEGALVIMDNAKYHNVLVEDFFPSSSSTKRQLQNWLTRNGYVWHDNMLKSELLDMCLRWAPVPEFRLDRLAATKGISILRTPPYHPELQPIETCWAIVKNYMADNCDFTMKGLRERLPEAFAKVAASTCCKIISDVIKEEDRYWLEDEKLDEVYTADAKEEHLAEIGSPNEGADPYLGND